MVNRGIAVAQLVAEPGGPLRVLVSSMESRHRHQISGRPSGRVRPEKLGACGRSGKRSGVGR